MPKLHYLSTRGFHFQLYNFFRVLFIQNAAGVLYVHANFIRRKGYDLFMFYVIWRYQRVLKLLWIFSLHIQNVRSTLQSWIIVLRMSIKCIVPTEMILFYVCSYVHWLDKPKFFLWLRMAEWLIWLRLRTNFTVGKYVALKWQEP